MVTNANILVKLETLIDSLNTNQRTMAQRIMDSSDEIIIEFRGKICVKKANDIFEFMSYVKSKCNC